MTRATLTLALLALTSCRPAAPTRAAPATPATARASINGIDYAYQVRGQGEPLVLLHGGLMSFDSFDVVMPLLTRSGREVIVVDLEGHGRTPLGHRPIRCETIADDVDSLLLRIGRAQVDVLGYSFGGCVALRLAIQHPERVRRLVLVSTTYSSDAFYAEIDAQQRQLGAAMAPTMMELPLYRTYRAVAPRIDDFPRLLDAMGEHMRDAYDWSSEVAKLKMPVMLTFGDADLIRPEHQIKFYQLLGGGLKDAGWHRETMPKNRLAIVPDLTHYEGFASTRVTEIVLPFLDGQSPFKSCAEQSNGVPAPK